MVLNGLKKGCPDLCVVRPNGRVGWLEVKAGTGVSAAQKEVHATLLQRGHTVHVITDTTQLLPIIEGWKREDALE